MAEAAFAFDFASERLRRVLRDIERGPCILDDLRDVGASLWAGLMVEEVGELFESLRREAGSEARFHFHFSLPAALEPLPWETLYFERDLGFVACHPPHTLLRIPAETVGVPAPLHPPSRRLRILVVIPSGSGLDVEHEWHNLDLAVRLMRDSVEIERLIGRVTPDRLGEKLAAAAWDVVHFIGHGEQAAGGRPRVRLNSETAGENELWMIGEAFASLFHGSRVRLAVLNCCFGAQSSPLRSLSGLGPLLLRAGVPAIVAMRYEIPDSVAIKFSDRFYHDLLQGQDPGRVDLAVQRARESIFRNQSEDAARDFITPVLFLAGGRETLFEIEPAAARPSVEPALFAPAVGVELPAELVEALRAGLCVPVIGQRVLASSNVRSGGSLLGPRQLARDLAARFSYPLERDIEVCEAAGDWMDLQLLQRVCQYHVARRGREFYKVTQAVQSAYGESRPPALLASIAAWNVPGAFYLYFDGLLEAAFDGLGKPVRVVNAVDRAVPPGSPPLLVHLRGTHKEADSLVLTEQDHDRLWDSIGRMTPAITELVRGHIGRSLVFLGVNPRDPLVKRLTSKLLEQASFRTLGPIFFACRSGENDDPYWEPYPITWIEGDLDELVDALSLAAGRSH